MKHFFTLTIAFLSVAMIANAQENWPRTITGDDGSRISVYEPEPEYFSGDEFTGRAAVSVRKSEGDEPVFGAILFTATLKDSRSSRPVELQSFRITRMKFSGEEDDEKLAHFTDLVEDDALNWNWKMTTDELRQRIDREKDAQAGTGFNNAPPKIIYTNKPTTLVVLNGEPRVLYDKDLATDKVVNSPNIIFKEKGKWNLYAGGNWYISNDVTKNWKLNTNLSGKVRSVHEAIKKQEQENNDGKKIEATPRSTEIIVATEPTELIQTEGEPVYSNVPGTSLLYVSNSPNEIFKDINTQRTYLLIAGRWYYSRDLDGPWQYIPADKLPEDFAKIPEGSEKDAVLASVAGTEAAESAVLDAAVPQTAKVDRRTATIDVEYDGAPSFSRIRGTSLSLAENSNVTVIRDADGYYFALDNGIWFISDDAYGPWAVANDRPRDIDDIPASSPAYYSRYVHVYDVTPDFVYMGYTPGYLGSYIYGPTIVYGTGYYYRPWFRRVYYPRPITWGFGFIYDPWYGWNFNFGYNPGFLYVGFNYGRPHYYGYGGGWFGPYRYCPSYRRPYWTGGYYGRGEYYGRRNNVYGNRPSRDYYGSARGENREMYGRVRNNLYADQRGVSSSPVVRNTRVYRPGAFENARETTGVQRGQGLQRPDVNRRQMPTLSNPQRSGSQEGNREERPSFRERSSSNRERPSLENNERRQRPTLQNRESIRVQPPSGESRQPLRVQRPSAGEGGTQQRPSLRSRESIRVQRPSVENREPARIQRPSVENRSSAPRPSFENRQSSPRPSIQNRQPAPRPSVQQRPPSSNGGGGARPSNNTQSSRPDRR